MLYFLPNLLRPDILKIFIALFFHGKWIMEQQNAANEED